MRQFAVKRDCEHWQLGHWTSEHEPLANYILRHATLEILIRIRVLAKSAGSKIPILHLWTICETADFEIEKVFVKLGLF
jgi:hypothetical protein